MIEIRETQLEGVVEIIPVRFEDERGFFSETWSRNRLRENGIDIDFTQDNHSLSRRKGTLRGLHYQLPPSAQDKLVRAGRGALFDVAVDIRKDSPRFGKWTATILSAENGKQFLIPKGFAHGFVALEDETECLYKVSHPYAPESDRVIRFDDPDIAIEWPFPVEEMLLSEKDRNAPFLKDAEIFDSEDAKGSRGK